METKKIKIELTFGEVANLTNHYLASWCEWCEIGQKERAKGKEHEADLSFVIAEDKKKAYEKFKAIREEMEGGEQ